MAKGPCQPQYRSMLAFQLAGGYPSVHLKAIPSNKLGTGDQSTTLLGNVKDWNLICQTSPALVNAYSSTIMIQSLEEYS